MIMTSAVPRVEHHAYQPSSVLQAIHISFLSPFIYRWTHALHAGNIITVLYNLSNQQLLASSTDHRRYYSNCENARNQISRPCRAGLPRGSSAQYPSDYGFSHS